MYIRNNYNSFENKVVDVSDEIDDIIARKRLKAWEIEIDELTEDQRNYLESWKLQ